MAFTAHRPAALLLLCAGLTAQDPSRLTLESLYHPAKKVNYVEVPSTRLQWLKDGDLLETRLDRATGSVALLRVDPATFEAKPLMDGDKVLEALKTAGAEEQAAKTALGRAAFTWNGDRSAFLADVAEDLYLVDLKALAARRLTHAAGSEDEASFSPDGTHVAFLRGNDLYVVATADAKEARLTTGGGENRFNGRLDWVYQEEVYGRGNFKGYWWAPDSKRIAYLSLDETKVPTFTLVDDRSQPQKLLQARYPKVGDPNPVAALGVVDLAGKTTWMKDPYAGQESLIVQVGWDPRGRLLASYQDRVQTWLDLVMYDGESLKSVLKETSKAWQERLPLPVFLKDGSFLWESSRTGFQHLYRYDASYQLAGAVTSGEWEVKAFHGVDEKAGKVYFSGTERSPIGQDAYRVDLKGKAPNAGLTKLTEPRGVHSVRFNPAFNAFLDTWSSREVLPRQELLDAAGKVTRVIDAKVTDAYKALRLGKVKYQQVPTRDGFPMETMLVLPPDFDAAKKYPVFQHIYGGPAAPQVRDAFSRDLPWFHFLAQQGYAVWVCDNRSASAKGIASAFGIWHAMGNPELQDQLDGLAWLKAQGWADMDRIALEGWSYGGYFTAFALTHSKAWKIGLVGAPVTDMRLYDSIYTERYMGLPKDHEKGYDAGSVLKAAKDLSGKILLMHGTLDDNVHPQNTLQFIDALQKANKPYELQLYPGSDHGPRAPQHVWSRMNAMWDFLKRNL